MAAAFMAEGTAVPSDARERVQEDSAGSAMEAAALVDAAWHATRGGSAVRRQRQSLVCGGALFLCTDGVARPDRGTSRLWL